MRTEFLSFTELNPQQLYDVLKLRQQVFMIEQECLYEDIDGDDPKAIHVLLYDGHILAGYLRIFEPGIKFSETSLGRIVIQPSYRGKDAGRQLIKTGITKSFLRYPSSAIRIEAQFKLKSYYNNYGFVEEGDKYVVDDILHIQMVLKSAS